MINVLSLTPPVGAVGVDPNSYLVVEIESTVGWAGDWSAFGFDPDGLGIQDAWFSSTGFQAGWEGSWTIVGLVATLQIRPIGGWDPNTYYSRPELSEEGSPPAGEVHLYAQLMDDDLDAWGFDSNDIEFTTSAGGGPALSIDTAALAGGTEGAAYSEGVTASGGTGAGFSWAISAGALPPGLSLAAAGTPTALITGTPSTPGTYPFTVEVTDDGANTDTQALEIVIAAAPVPLAITTTELADGARDEIYAQAVVAEGGSEAGYAWSVVVGSLPPGLAIAAEGTPQTLISGTPTEPGSWSFVLRVEDDAGAADLQALTIDVPVPQAEPAITDHCAAAINRLAAQYRGQPHIEGVVCIFGDRVQLVEQEVANLAAFRLLDAAYGALLDQIGRKVVLLREGLDDAEYRVRLRAKVRALASRGLASDLAAVMALLGNGRPITATVRDAYPAGAIAEATPLELAEGRAWGRLLRPVAPAGVRLVLHHDAGSDLFGWDEDETALPFAEADDGETGGIWAEAT